MKEDTHVPLDFAFDGFNDADVRALTQLFCSFEALKGHLHFFLFKRHHGVLQTDRQVSQVKREVVWRWWWIYIPVLEQTIKTKKLKTKKYLQNLNKIKKSRFIYSWNVKPNYLSVCLKKKRWENFEMNFRFVFFYFYLISLFMSCGSPGLQGPHCLAILLCHCTFIGVNISPHHILKHLL